MQEGPGASRRQANLNTGVQNLAGMANLRPSEKQASKDLHGGGGNTELPSRAVCPLV